MQVVTLPMFHMSAVTIPHILCFLSPSNTLDRAFIRQRHAKTCVQKEALHSLERAITHHDFLIELLHHTQNH